MASNAKQHVHQFDSAAEVNPTDFQRAQYYNVLLQDNLSFDTPDLQYTLSTPSVPTRTISFNMGTKRTKQLHSDHYQNMNKVLPELHTEKIDVPMRDGTQIPLVLKYDKRFYNERSPWVLFTRGKDSAKDMLSYQQNDLALMSRGLVCAYPVLRGTKMLDRDWLLKGTAERKLTHIMDFIDAAIYLKQNDLASKLAVHAAGESGAITALTSVFQEPYLFETAVVHNPITDLVHHMFHDIETRRPTSESSLEHDLRHSEKLAEFGDPQNLLFYQTMKLISPYH